MRYLKSFLTGVAFAMAVAFIYSIISLSYSYHSDEQFSDAAVFWGGSTSSANVAVGPLLFMLAPTAFAGGFLWMFRRTAR